MRPSRDIDEATADVLLSATPKPLDDELGAVVGFLTELRAAASGPPAPLSRPLATILRAGMSVAPAAPAVSHRRPARWRRVLASSAIGLALAGSSIAVAAAADLLPDGFTRAVGPVIESLTPFDVPTPKRPSSALVPNEPGSVAPHVGGPSSSPAAADNTGRPVGATVVSPPSGTASTTPATTLGRLPVPPSTVAPTTPSVVVAPSTTLPTATLRPIRPVPPTTVPVPSPRPTLPEVRLP